MKIVIVGDHTRSNPEDFALVNAIIDDCKLRYGKFRIITKDCSRGVGKIIKTRLTDPVTRRPRELDWTELSIQHYMIGEDMPRLEFSSDFDALNSTLTDIGDVFHILSEEKPRGVTMNLLRRVIDAHRPYVLYKPGETTAKKAEFHEYH